MPTAPSPLESFTELSLATSNGLTAAIRELGWIINGLIPTATAADEAIAVEQQDGFKRERTRVNQRLVAALSKNLSINPPSPGDVAKAEEIATRLASFAQVNVTVTAIVDAATNILNIYNNKA